MKDHVRPHYLGQLGFYRLNHACIPLAKAYGVGVFLVGSALKTSAYRDVDVRCILHDDDYALMFPDVTPEFQHRSSAWLFLCAAISSYLETMTGLPVDFQFQQMTAANAEFPGERNAIGH